MEIKTKFSNGDKVWIIQKDNYVYEDCNICENTGAVKIKGEEFLCPQCQGERKKINKVYWQVDNEPRTIHKVIIVKFEDRPTKVSYFYLHKSKCYIIEIQEKYCFATQAEAQEECNRRNNEK